MVPTVLRGERGGTSFVTLCVFCHELGGGKEAKPRRAAERHLEIILTVFYPDSGHFCYIPNSRRFLSLPSKQFPQFQENQATLKQKSIFMFKCTMESVSRFGSS